MRTAVDTVPSDARAECAPESRSISVLTRSCVLSRSMVCGQTGQSLLSSTAPVAIDFIGVRHTKIPNVSAMAAPIEDFIARDVRTSQ